MAEIIGPDLDEYEQSERDRLTQEVDQLLEDIENNENRVELSAEVIAQNQQLYDALGIEIDLAEEARLGRILTPTREQAGAIEAENYDLPIVLDGRLSRLITVDRVRKYFSEKYHTEGLYFWPHDYQITQAAIHPPQPKGLYLTYFRPIEEVDKAQPELPMGKTFTEYLNLVKTLQEQNPNLGLQGPTLEQYLLGQVAQDLQGKHFEEHKWTWLLEEIIIDNQNRPARCLNARWFGSKVYVVSDDSFSGGFDRGARLAAVPRDSSFFSFFPSSPKEIKFFRDTLIKTFGGGIDRFLPDDDLRWQWLYQGLNKVNNHQPSILARIINSGRGGEFREKLFGRFRERLLLRPTERPPGEGLLRPAHEASQESNSDELLRPSERPEE